MPPIHKTNPVSLLGISEGLCELHDRLNQVTERSFATESTSAMTDDSFEQQKEQA